MIEAFVYCWTDLTTHKVYIGFHKGSTTDGYISSSKYFNAEYNKRSSDFSRTVIAEGTVADMKNFERVILEKFNAAKDPLFYNKHNGGKTFICDGHSKKTRLKMSNTWKRAKFWNCDNKKAIEAWQGSKHSTASKAKMSAAQTKHSEKRKRLMSDHNPMKNPESIAKMLASRKERKENGCSS